MVSHYYAFLMRIWHHGDQTPGQWFLSLEDPTSHEITYFKTKDELFLFISNMLNEQEKQFAAEKGTLPGS